MTIEIFTTAMLVYLVAVGPWLARRDLASVRRDLASGDGGARLRSYRSTIVYLWILAAILLAGWLVMGRSVADVGLTFSPAGWQWIALAVCLVATVQIAYYFHRASRDTDGLAALRSQLGNLEALMPHTRAELRRFNWVSIAAGVCEEFIYRGLLMTALTAIVGLWPAVILSSIVFGIGHSYQGATGILRTGLVGLVMALVVVLTGSLAMAMVMHAVLDIAQGRLIWTALDGRSEAAGSSVEAVQGLA